MSSVHYVQRIELHLSSLIHLWYLLFLLLWARDKNKVDHTRVQAENVTRKASEPLGLKFATPSIK